MKNKFSEIKKNKWIKVISNKYFIIVILFAIWMVFFDTNSYFIHNELDNNIESLEKLKAVYVKEIEHDKKFIEKMKDSNELEKFAREKYYLKKDNEDIYIIENLDSLDNN